MIIKVNIQVDFLNQTITEQSKNIVEGDYNTTELVFDFIGDVSGKRIVFEMSNPNGEMVFLEEVIDNKIMLVGQTSQGQFCSLFNSPGLYPFELSLYGTDSKLTSTPGYLSVTKQQVSTEGSAVPGYLPLLDRIVTSLDSKIPFPQISGTEGQMLTLDSEGKPIWSNGNYATEEYVTNSVQEALGSIETTLETLTTGGGI